MKDTIKRLQFNSSLLEFKDEVNSGFGRVKISVMTYEQVANGTHFSKEVIDNSVKGLNYLPVVAEFKSKIEDGQEVGDFGTHGGKIIIDDDGIKFIETTIPYGVVIKDSYKWEKIKQKNGEEVEYLTVEAYIWLDRYPELQKLYEGEENNQSMEIKVIEYERNDSTNILEIKSFLFSALCLLGKSIVPAFSEAKVMTGYSNDNFKAQYEEMIFALNEYLQKNDSKEVFEMPKDNTNTFSNDKKEKDLQFSATYRQKLDILRNAIYAKNESEVDIEGNYVSEIYYYLMDFDDNYIYAERSEWKRNEGRNKKIVRFEYTFSEDDLTATASDEYVEMIMTLLTKEEFDKLQEERKNYEEKYNSLKLDFDSLTEQFNTLKEENEKLVEFKQEKVRDEKNAKIAEFSEKLTEEELSLVYENIDNLTIEEIEIKCFALYGMKKNDVDITDKKNTKQIFTNKFTVDKKTQSWFEGFVD